MMTKGSDLIAAERQRQIDSEGYSLEKDRGAVLNLAIAGLNYVHQAAMQLATGLKMIDAGPIDKWPWFWPWGKSYWKPSEEPLRNLIKAGALIAAAIDAQLAKDEEKKEMATKLMSAPILTFKAHLVTYPNGTIHSCVCDIKEDHEIKMISQEDLVRLTHGIPTADDIARVLDKLDGE